eukprot:scaffold307_cov390-Prasinococcus_capsulatus_cf.AAC.1
MSCCAVWGELVFLEGVLRGCRSADVAMLPATNVGVPHSALRLAYKTRATPSFAQVSAGRAFSSRRRPGRRHLPPTTVSVAHALTCCGLAHLGDQVSRLAAARQAMRSWEN